MEPDVEFAEFESWPPIASGLGIEFTEKQALDDLDDLASDYFRSLNRVHSPRQQLPTTYPDNLITEQQQQQQQQEQQDGSSSSNGRIRLAFEGLQKRDNWPRHQDRRDKKATPCFFNVITCF